MESIPIGKILEQLPQQTRADVQALFLLPDVVNHTAALRQLLEPHRDALATLGLIPGYAAYAMAYMVAQHQEQEAKLAPHLVVLTRN